MTCAPTRPVPSRPIRRLVHLAALSLAAASAIACARAPIVGSDTLPVQRVVVYRNGVAYFERAGHVDREEVRFKMRQGELGDFLATLAVMERGGSSVRAAAFPLDVDAENKAEQASDSDDAPHPAAEPAKNDLKTVVLALDGRGHDLQVGYIAESPVWRPSYRLVMQAGGQADLQAWGIVENLSGEDWRGVKLSLVAGAPVSFRAELGTPIVPARPQVSDRGEVIAAVPEGETSLATDSKPTVDALTAMPAPKAASGEGGGQHLGARRMRKGAATDEPAAPPAPPMAEAPAPEASRAPQYALSPPRDLRALAAVAVEAGTTRYDLPAAVTVPDRSATMVMLLARTVSGEALFLFAPDGGVTDSRSHPFRVARFVNATDGVLERGPIAVFEQGAFLGQGMVDTLPAGATATVPFALEKSIAVESNVNWDVRGERVAKIESERLVLDRDRVMLTRYRLKNGGDALAKVLLKHGRWRDSRLVAPPAGTDDNVGTGFALVPASVASHSTSELTVEERTHETSPADWFSAEADKAVTTYLADAKSDAAVVRKLGACWDTRRDILKAREARAHAEKEGDDLSRATEETRRNLQAIEKNRTADALRAKLTARLAETSARLDVVHRRTVELDATLAELNVKFTEGLRDIDVVVPPPGP